MLDEAGPICICLLEEVDLLCGDFFEVACPLNICLLGGVNPVCACLVELADTVCSCLLEGVDKFCLSESVCIGFLEDAALL